MKRICLITHCEAQHTVQKRVGGWFDSELTEKGRQQAASLVPKIKANGFDIHGATIYCSDLKRAAQTAEIIAEGTNAKIVADQRLREMSFGDHGGMNQAKHDKIMIPVSEDGNRLDHKICNGAESRRIVAERIEEFVTELMISDRDEIVVTHGFAATFFIAAFQKIHLSSMGYIYYKLNPGSVTILIEDDLFKNRTIQLLNG